MRNTMIANMLNCVAYNLNHGNDVIMGFEVGNTFKNIENTPVETMQLCVGICDTDFDFFKFKGVLENCFDGLKLLDRRYKAQMQKTSFILADVQM